MKIKYLRRHGPRGGDEINLITLNKIWMAIVYGPTYKKDYII